MKSLPERKESLWLLTVSPAVWAAHFMLCYVTAAIWCAKVAGPDGSLGPVRIAIGIYTVLALAGIGINGWIGYRRHRLGNAGAHARPRHLDSPEDRHRFLGFATLLLSTLSAVATLYAALVVIFIWNCN